MSLPQRFSDSEYKNWLKCMDAFIVLKEGLHQFIDTGVNKLHEDIKQRVLNFYGGVNSVIQCNSCSSNDIWRKRATGQNPDKWMINCPNNICDVWLDEILAVHNEPNKQSISWRTSEVTKWATDPYEIAKVFMPKGLKKTKLPEELDIQAVLSLLKYCTYFSKSVPNAQLLTKLIDVRNTLYHSGTFKAGDSERDTWIDMMSDLVTVLNLQGTIHSYICMMKTGQISINFQETETRVLMNSVTLLKFELEAVDSEIAYLKETLIRLSLQTQKTEDNTSETTMKTNILEKDMKEVKLCLTELTQISDKIVIFLENNDIKDKDILTGAGCNEKIVVDLISRHLEVEKKISDIKYELSSVKEDLVRNKEETAQLRKTIGVNQLEVKGYQRQSSLTCGCVLLFWSLVTDILLPVTLGAATTKYRNELTILLGDGVESLTYLTYFLVIFGICSFTLSTVYLYVCYTENGRKTCVFLTIGIISVLMFAVGFGVVFCAEYARKFPDEEGRSFLMKKIISTYDGVLPSKKTLPFALDIVKNGLPDDGSRSVHMKKMIWIKGGVFFPNGIFPFVLDMAQITLKCCGIQHYTDFYSAEKWNRTTTIANKTMIIPPSCCKMKNVDQGRLEPINPTCTVDGFESNKDKPCWDDIKWYYNYVNYLSVASFLIQVKRQLVATKIVRSFYTQALF